MFLAASLLILLFALSITGSPVEVRNSSITLPLTRRLRFSNGTINLLQHDRARVAAFRGYNTHDRRADSIPVISTFMEYTAAVGIGSPPTICQFNTKKTSITWVGASTRYVKTATSVKTGWPVKGEYGFEHYDTKCSFSGIIYRDSVTLGDGLTVTNFQLGVASISEGFDADEDGILGIGPRELSLTTMPFAMDDTIPTFTDYLYDQDRIGRWYVVGIFFQPATTEPDSQFGELTFGKTDSTKYVGNVVYTPITDMPPSSRFWGIKQSITYGTTMILDSTAGIVDTGTTFLYLATDAYAKYEAATGGTLDQKTGLLIITPDQYRALQKLDFHIGGKIFSLTPNAQIWPRPLNTKLPGGETGVIYLIVEDIGTHSGLGYDFIIGYTFIQRFYTAFDRSKSRVGFAVTPFTYATTN